MPTPDRPSSHPIATTLRNGIATLSIDRPAKRNALSCAMWTTIADVVERWSADADVRVVAIAGAGADFSAGADIDEFATVYADRASGAAYAALLARTMDIVAACPKPTVAGIRGVCIGAGLALALRCDVRIAAAGARFAITPAKLGLAYAFEDTRSLVDAVGPGAARDLLMSARLVDGDEAVRMRLIERLVAADAFDATFDDYLARLAAMSSTSAAIAKRFVARAVAGQTHEDDATRRDYLDAIEGPDFAEGRAAFVARREPAFRPR